VTVALVATALAAAFLDGPWTPADLNARAAAALGGRPRTWVTAVVADVLARHPRPPLDAPRRFSAEVAAHPALQRAVQTARRRGHPLAPAHLEPLAGAMVRRPWPVPVLDGAADLARLLDLDPAQLDWFADVRGMQRRAPGTRLHHYSSRWLGKRGAPRLLEAPKPRLRALQRTVLRSVLDVVPAHDVVHGFVPGRSALTGARVHTGAPVVVRLDLSAFFASIGAERVYGRFRLLGYPEAVAHLLTGLCTHRTPLAVLRTMPAGGDSDDRFRLRQWLTTAHLPQGAPTSPALANLVAAGLDRRLAGLATSLGLQCTRYADDVTFSGGPLVPGGDLGAGAARLVRCVSAIAADEGFTVNPAKTLVRGAGARQVVTGIVVNERTGIPRDEFDRLKALLHNAVRFGPASQDRQGHHDFRAHLAGRVSWVEAVSPGRGRRLRETFDRIAWG